MTALVNDRDVFLLASPRFTSDSSKALFLSANAEVFHVTYAGVGSPTSLTLTAQLVNMIGTVTFTPSAGATISTVGNVATLTFANTTLDTVSVTASITIDGFTYTDIQVITKVYDGATGNQNAQASLFQWAVSAPAAPTGTSTYTWATGVNSAYSVVDGWAVSVPSNPGTPGLQLWTVSKPITTITATTSTVSYSGLTPSAITMNGATGATGAPGVKSAIARAYQWGLSAPTATGSATYTWSTASYDTVPTTGWSMSKPAPPSAGYTLYEVAVGLVDSTTATTASINWTTGSVASIGYVGINGVTAISGVLSNQNAVVPTDSAGAGGVFTGCVSTMTIYNGATDDSTNWTVAATPGTGVTGSLTGKTYTVTALSVDTGYVDLVASRSGYSSITQRFSITKARGGVAATAYWLTRSAGAIQKNLAGDYTPTTITFSGFSATGTAAPAAYSGRFIISTTTDGTTFTTQYTSSSDESSKVYTIPASIVAVRARMYLAGGTTTLLDEELAPVVSDGGTGATGGAAKICYSLADTSTLNLTPTTFTATGTAFPTTGTWGETRAWVAQPTPAPTAGQAWFQCNGIYDGVHTVWGIPYLSQLKVGSLSAISANLGSITAGSVHGASFHTGGMTSYTWPAAGAGGGTYLGPGGLIIGNFNDGKYFQVNDNGDLAMPGFTVTSGAAVFTGALSGVTGTFAGTVSAGATIAATISGSQVTGGTISGINLNANTTITNFFQTAASGFGIYIDGTTSKRLRVDEDLGHGSGLETIAQIGAVTSLTACGVFGTQSSGNTRGGVFGFSYSGYGVSGTSTGTYGVYGSSNATVGVYGSGVTVGVEAIASSGYGVKATSSSSYGVYAISTTSYGLYATSNSGTGIKGSSAGGTGVEGAGSSGSFYDFYATGAGVNYGPFTGGHDGLALLGDSFTPGDILVDVAIVARTNISNTIAHNALSSATAQKNIIGVFVGEKPLDPANPPAALRDYPDLATLAETYKCLTQNAVGEGQINVCGEAGDIEAGDYITTSSTPGKGMKQADDIHHNYTVAKARESVTFSSPSEVKLVACTYHCG